jgi:hypothetical protein
MRITISVGIENAADVQSFKVWVTKEIPARGFLANLPGVYVFLCVKTQ